MSRLAALPAGPPPETLSATEALSSAMEILDDMDALYFKFGQVPISVDQLLSNALQYAPDAGGRAWLARVIDATGGDPKKLLMVARLFFWELILPLKTKCSRYLPKVLNKASAMGSNIRQEDTSPLGSPTETLALTAKVLTRDNHTCCITGATYSIPPESWRESDIRVTWILPPSLEDSSDDYFNVCYESCIFWEALRKWCPSFNIDSMKGELIRSPSNAITLTQNARVAFLDMDLCLIRTGRPDTYDARNWLRDPHRYMALPTGPVHLSDYSEIPVPLPDGTYLSVHAAIARVSQACGANQAITAMLATSIQLHNMDTKGMTDVEGLLSMLLIASPRRLVDGARRSKD